MDPHGQVARRTVICSCRPGRIQRGYQDARARGCDQGRRRWGTTDDQADLRLDILRFTGYIHSMLSSLTVLVRSNNGCMLIYRMVQVILQILLFQSRRHPRSRSAYTSPPPPRSGDEIARSASSLRLLGLHPCMIDSITFTPGEDTCLVEYNLLSVDSRRLEETCLSTRCAKRPFHRAKRSLRSTPTMFSPARMPRSRRVSAILG